MDLKNKHFLITAGPTYIAIDDVRVISNLATAKTGIMLANKLARLGAKVVLICGPSEKSGLDKKVKVAGFRFFDELKNLFIKNLKTKKFDFLVHSAAVSDFRPRKVFDKKISSDKNGLKLELIRTEKLIDLAKKNAPKTFLVGFKYEPEAKKTFLIKEALGLIKKSKADLVVANTMIKDKYSAYLVSEENVSGVINSKTELVNALIKKLSF